MNKTFEIMWWNFIVPGDLRNDEKLQARGISPEAGIKNRSTRDWEGLWF